MSSYWQLGTCINCKLSKSYRFAQIVHVSNNTAKDILSHCSCQSKLTAT